MARRARAIPPNKPPFGRAIIATAAGTLPAQATQLAVTITEGDFAGREFRLTTPTLSAVTIDTTETTWTKTTISSVDTIASGVWNGTDIAVADGGTGASTASGARTNLGLVIGTDVQGYDAGLASFTGVDTAADLMGYTTAANTWASTSLTSFARTLLDDADAATARSTLGVSSAGAPVFQCRLTLTSGTPVTTADVTSATVVYLTPYDGATFWLTTGGNTSFTEKSLKLTDAQTGTTTSGNAIISGLSDTSQLVRGMLITGTNVGAASVIATIDSATQVTGTVNSTGSASNTITFKTVSGKLYDIFAIPSGGAVKLRFGTVWTNTTTRATAIDNTVVAGVYTNSAAIGSGDSNAIAANVGVYVGTVYCNANGSTDDIVQTSRLVWNNFNRVKRFIYYVDTTNTWSYGTAAWQSANAVSSAHCKFVIGLSENLVEATATSIVDAALSVTGSAGIGVDSTSANSAITYGEIASSVAAGITRALSIANYRGYPGIGYHYLQWLEYARLGTVTFTGDLGTSSNQSGLVVTVWG